MAPEAERTTTQLDPKTGLPPGWRERTKTIMTGLKAGGTMIVFENDSEVGKSKQVDSIKKLMKLVCDKTGEDLETLTQQSLAIREPKKGTKPAAEAKAEPKAKAKAKVKGKAAPKAEEPPKAKEEPKAKRKASEDAPKANNDAVAAEPAPKVRKQSNDEGEEKLDPVTLLPKGWLQVEKQYKTGGSVGKTYVRYMREDGVGGATWGSMTAVLQKHLEDTGEDLTSLYLEMKQKKKEAQASASTKASGLLAAVKKEDRQRYIDLYRSLHGALSGALLCALPGWKGESRHLEKCGQYQAVYYDPSGRKWFILRDVEAYWGKLIEEGKQDEVPDIEAAKDNVATDENGQVINIARQQNIVEDWSVEPVATKKPKQQTLGQTTADYAYYRDCPYLQVLDICSMSDAQMKKDKWSEPGPSLPSLQKEGEQIRTLLRKRGVPESAKVVYMRGTERKVTGCKFIKIVTGWYYERDCRESPNTPQPCFQQVKRNASRLACTECHIFYTKRGYWKLGRLDDARAGLAICQDSNKEVWSLDERWRLYEPPFVADPTPAASPSA